MTTHHLLHHFAPITEAPAAVARLRQFVLDLAVRGKLVAQEPSDEPASELLKQISAKKERLFAAGQTAKPEPLIPIDEDSLSFHLPSGWQIVPMNWLAQKLGAGSTPLGGKSVYQEEGVPFLRSQNVHNDGLRLDDVALIPRAIHERMSGTHIQPQDLLLNITGASIGRCALVPSTFAEGNVSQHVAIIRLFEPAIREFIHLSLISPFYQQMIMDVQVGVSREGLSMQSLKLFPMVIPPLAEQQRIVAKVDELMTLCDELAAAQNEREARRDRLVAATLHRLAASAADPAPFPERARFYFTHLPRLTTRPEHIHQLRQTILNLAVQGKLVLQDPHDEPASELLKQVIEAKKRSCNSLTLVGEKQLLPLNFFEEMPFELPSGWAGCLLDTILLKIEAGRSFAAQAKAAEKNEKGVLKVSAVTWGKFLPNENKALFSSEKIEGNFSVKAGDVLITRANTSELVGAVVLVEEDHPNLLLSDKTLRLIFASDLIFRPFILYALRSPWVRNYFAENASGTSHSMRNLSQEKIRMAPIALPPLAEQQRIIARVDELLVLCDELAANLDTVTATRRRLLEAALQEALVAA